MDSSLTPNLEDSERISRSMRALSYEEAKEGVSDYIEKPLQEGGLTSWDRVALPFVGKKAAKAVDHLNVVDISGLMKMIHDKDTKVREGKALFTSNSKVAGSANSSSCYPSKSIKFREDSA